jgi:hypothetical protein
MLEPKKQRLINQSHLLVSKHIDIEVRQAGKDTTDHLLHGLPRDTLQQLPLGPGLLHHPEAGGDDRADVSVGERRSGATHTGEQHLQNPGKDGLLGRRVGDLEAAPRDCVDDSAHGLSSAGCAGFDEV